MDRPKPDFTAQRILPVDPGLIEKIAESMAAPMKRHGVRHWRSSYDATSRMLTVKGWIGDPEP